MEFRNEFVIFFVVDYELSHVTELIGIFNDNDKS